MKKLVVLATLPLVLWLFFNQIAFWHYHVLENGMVVEHAHPYSKSNTPGQPYQNHHHCDFEYSILAGLSNIIGLLVFLLALGFLLNQPATALIENFRARIIASDYLSLQRLRGPPATSC